MRLSSITDRFLSATSRTRAGVTLHVRAGPAGADGARTRPGPFRRGWIRMFRLRAAAENEVTAATATHDSPMRLIGSSLHHRPGFGLDPLRCKGSDVSWTMTARTHNLAPCRPMPTATSSQAAVRDANPTRVGTSDSADPVAITL